MNRNCLTSKQARFIEEYLIDLNATQAAIRAGYSEKTAYSQGEGLLRNVDVAAAVAEAKAARSERTEITQDRVIEEYAKLAFIEMGMFVEWGENGVTLKASADLPPELRAAVAEVSETTTEHGGTVRFKLHDKKGALDSLARHLGMFKDNLNVGLTVRYEEALKELA